MSLAINTAIQSPETAPPARGVQLLEMPRNKDAYELLPWLPCTLALDIPVVHFTVGHLLALGRGSIVETAYHQSSDLPLHVNGQLVGWTEFEVVGDRLAVRLTELS
jgi:flagellar motor switch/type III secretory pathway protein FliN